MVYPQCLLNFIELLYSQGAAHGKIVQTVWDILRKRDSPVPCFQSHPPTSLHERILPSKDTQKRRPISEGFFSTMFCLESMKASWQSGLKTEGSCHFIFSFCGMRMNLMTCQECSNRSVLSFSVFNLRFFFLFDHFTCVRVCACSFCIPPI